MASKATNIQSGPRPRAAYLESRGVCRHTCPLCADHGDSVQAAFVVDQTRHAFGQDSVVRTVPRAAQRHGHAPDARRARHHRGDRPPHDRLGQPPPVRGHTRQIILPRAPAPPTLAATAAGQQMNPGLAQGRVDEPTPTRAAHRRGTPAIRARPRRLNGLATDLPHAAPAATRHMTLCHAPQSQRIQPQQRIPVEPVRLAYRP